MKFQKIKSSSDENLIRYEYGMASMFLPIDGEGYLWFAGVDFLEIDSREDFEAFIEMLQDANAEWRKTEEGDNEIHEN